MTRATLPRLGIDAGSRPSLIGSRRCKPLLDHYCALLRPARLSLWLPSTVLPHRGVPTTVFTRHIAPMLPCHHLDTRRHAHRAVHNGGYGDKTASPAREKGALRRLHRTPERAAALRAAVAHFGDGDSCNGLDAAHDDGLARADPAAHVGAARPSGPPAPPRANSGAVNGVRVGGAPLEASRKPGVAPESAHPKGNFTCRLPNIPLNKPSTLDGSRPDRRTAGGPGAGMAAARACRYGMRTAAAEAAAARTGRG